MIIKHRYALDTNRKIIKILQKRNIEYNIESGILIFTIEEDNQYFDEISNQVKIKSIVSKEFSRKELDEASWYSVRSIWTVGYPLPEDEYIEATFDQNRYCLNCRSNQFQINSYIIKPFEWKTRFFCTLFWQDRVLMVSAKCLSILKESQILGYTEKPVLNKKKEEYDDIIQILPNELIDGIDYDASRIEYIWACPVCGTKKYFPPKGQLTIHKEAFNNINSDYLSTVTQFGKYGSNRINIISKKLYDTIIRNNLDKNLEIEPIKII
ncbi:MAG: hypothetical protein PHP50_07800 [Lachnospiraceae bacterium]|nr:hypothetical protein [Lachnospiraceae bacterium]